MNWHGPSFRNASDGEEKNFDHGIIGREWGAVTDDAAQGAVERLDGVGGVDGAADIWWIVEKRGDVGPVVTPGLGDNRILVLPVLFERGERSSSVV